MPAQMRATHPSGLIEMRVGTFQQFAALPQQLAPARAPNATTIRICTSDAPRLHGDMVRQLP